MTDSLWESFKAAELAQFLKDRAEEEQVLRARRSDQLMPQLWLQRASMDFQILADHGVYLGLAGARQVVFYPAAFVERVQRRTGKRGGEHGDMRRKVARQEG